MKINQYEQEMEQCDKKTKLKLYCMKVIEKHLYLLYLNIIIIL